MKTLIKLSVFILILSLSCKPGTQKSEAISAGGKVPVTVTGISIQDIYDAIELNATSVFLLKTYVKSATNGYLQEVNAQTGDYITKGGRMFIIRSKESQNIGNSVSSVDTTLHFNGLVSLFSPGNGYVTQLTYRAGDYVQDGETLAAISDAGSLVFMLDLPYELKPWLPGNKNVVLTLPDGQKLNGTISSSMPAVDPVSQTQNYVIRVSQSNSIPENLVARVHFIKNSRTKTVTLPKEAVLTNEVQSEFWIMKMINTGTAVKVPILKGIETNDMVEILSPKLSSTDKILLTGNYGLPDTAEVVVDDKSR